MSKLFHLKEWLTISEAAHHLSTVFSDHVTEADVLRLGLDRHLTLSVNFVNHAEARRGRMVPLEKAQFREVPANLTANVRRNASDKGKPLMLPTGIVIDEHCVLELEPGIVTLEGVYDLPMIGAERLDVEHEYQRMTNGPEVTLINLSGPFVQDEALSFFEVQESVENNEFQPGSRAALKRLEDKIELEKLGREESDQLLQRHADQRKDFIAQQRSQPVEEGYFSAGGLPRDGVFVVRTKALRELQERLEAVDEETKTKIGKRAETTYDNVIGALLGLLLGRTPSGQPNSVFDSQAAVKDAVLASYEGKPGISRRTLDVKFAAANRSIEST